MKRNANTASTPASTLACANVGQRTSSRSASRAPTPERAGLPELPAITPHSMRRTWATFAASIGRDPKWIAAQIGRAA